MRILPIVWLLGCNDPAAVSALQRSVAQLEAQLGAANQRIAELEMRTAELSETTHAIASNTEQLERLGAHLTVEEGDVVISGANLRIVSGAGATDAEENGTGNLIVGYDEGEVSGKGGSHNVVVGPGHSYRSHGALVTGVDHSVQAPYGAVVSGIHNEVTAAFGASIGGTLNVVSGSQCAQLGGERNVASGFVCTVVGGRENAAGSYYSHVSGGRGGQSMGYATVVRGGLDWAVSGNYGFVP